MPGRSRRARATTAVALALALTGGGLAAASPGHRASAQTAAQMLAAGDVPTDCYAPAGNPSPTKDASAWEARDRQNELCSTQRLTDELSNPPFTRRGQNRNRVRPPGATPMHTIADRASIR